MMSFRCAVAAIAAATCSGCTAFQHHTTLPRMAIDNVSKNPNNDLYIPSQRRRHSVSLMAGGFFSGLFGDDSDTNSNAAYAAADSNAKILNTGKGPTNEVIKQVNGMKQRRLGGSDIIVSELGLGTQRWVSSDFNAPNKDQVFEFMDKAVLKYGVNLIDTVSIVHI